MSPSQFEFLSCVAYCHVLGPQVRKRLLTKLQSCCPLKLAGDKGPCGPHYYKNGFDDGALFLHALQSV